MKQAPPEDWQPVTGQLIAGHRVASGTGEDRRYPAGTLLLQRPFFLALGLDLSGYHNGTLNIDITPFSWRIVRPEFSFDRVEWTHLHPPENFRFSRVAVQHATDLKRGLIYYPDPSTKAAHFQPPSVVEVIAETISNLRYGDQLTIWINPAEVEIVARQ